MSAGSGVRHSEFNNSKTAPVHFLQIWIQPNVAGVAPEYEEKRFEASEKRGRLRLIASQNGADGSVRIHQDARVYAGLFDSAEHFTLETANSRRTYVHVARGRVTANGEALAAGDALMLSGERTLKLSDGVEAEVIVFDLPGE